eukprot:COSAG03_NODE_21968_length_297_cov_0.535354_2_plen_24_part_01
MNNCLADSMAPHSPAFSNTESDLR